MSLLRTLGLLEALWNADQPCTSVQVYAADCADAVLLELRKHLPKYYGVWSPPTAPNGNAFSVHLMAWRFPFRPSLNEAHWYLHCLSPFP